MKKKKIIIAANFKMNKTHIEMRKYLESFFKKLKEFGIAGNFNDDMKRSVNIDSNYKSAFAGAEAEIIFAPAFTALNEAYNAIEAHPKFKNIIKLASQNVYYELSGAYTGEISIDMIKAFNCSYAIIGHSERRWIFNENDELIAKKIYAVLNYNKKKDTDNTDNNVHNNTERRCGKLVPILCVGENLEIKKSGKAFDFVAAQLDSALNYSADGSDNINGNINVADDIDIEKLIIAYEPIWAIGTGAPIEPEDGEKMHKFIYEYLTDNYSIKNLSVIYGGSVTEKNIKNLIEKDHIDGVLVGGASLEPQSFFNIYNFAVQTYS
jgi:triosephosphate isomerase